MTFTSNCVQRALTFRSFQILSFFWVSETWLFSSFIYLKDLFYSCKFFFYSQKGVHPAQEEFIHQALRVIWSVSIWEICWWTLDFFFQKRQKMDNKTAIRWLMKLLCPSSGLDFKNVFFWLGRHLTFSFELEC